MLLRSLAITGAALLTACVSAPELQAPQHATTQLTGRFVASYVQGASTQREQGAFEWQLAATDGKTTPAMRLRLISPLGTTVAVLALHPQAVAHERASLHHAQGTVYAVSLDALMQTTLGWVLPLEALLPWLGATPPAASQVQGWEIAVPSRHDNARPKLLTANHAQRQIGLRLVFEE